MPSSFATTRRGSLRAAKLGVSALALLTLLSCCSLAFEDDTLRRDSPEKPTPAPPTGGQGGAAGPPGEARGGSAGGGASGTGGTGGAIDAGSSGASGAALPPYDDVILADKPVAYYPFDEPTNITFAESVIAGAPPCELFDKANFGAPGLLPGEGGSAVTFAGGGCTFGDTFEFVGVNAFTAELWVANDFAARDEAQLIWKHGDPDNNPFLPGFFAYLRGGSSLHFVYNERDFIGSTEWAASFDFAGAQRPFYYVVFASDDAGSRLCLGTAPGEFACQEDPSPMRGSATNIDTPFVLGTTSLGVGRSMVGAIDAFALYDRALSPAALRQHFVAGLATAPAALARGAAPTLARPATPR